MAYLVIFLCYIITGLILYISINKDADKKLIRLIERNEVKDMVTDFIDVIFTVIVLPIIFVTVILFALYEKIKK